MVLQDKVVIITGAARGIGRAIAHAYAKAGASLVLNDITEMCLDDFSSRPILFVQGDVAKEKVAKSIVRQAYQRFNRIDVLVNNAGLRNLPYLGFDSCPVLKMKSSWFDRIISVNVRGPFLLSRAVLPIMIQQGKGSIINISSGAGKRGVPGKSAYSASKHALEGFSKSLAEEVREFGIRVNILSPGGRVNVDGRGGLPVEVIIPAAIFLASDDSISLTGQSIAATNFNEAASTGNGGLI